MKALVRSIAYLAVPVLGCAAPGPAAPRAVDPVEIDLPEEPTPPLRSRSLPLPLSDAAPHRPVDLSPSRAQPPRPPGSRRRIDVRFRDAELEDALRLLAEAGGFDLVIDAPLKGRVDLDLRRVRPFEALLLLVETHRARASLRGRVVVVSPARRAGPAR